MVLNTFPVQKPFSRAPTCTWMVGTEFWPLVRAVHPHNHQATSPVSCFLKVSWQSFYWLVLGVIRRGSENGLPTFLFCLEYIFCVYVYACVSVGMCVCTCVRRLEVTVQCLNCSPSFVFETVVLLTPVLTDWLEWSVAEIHHNHNLLKCGFWASDLRYLCFHNKYFNWAICPAFRIWYLFIIHASEFFIEVLN